MGECESLKLTFLGEHHQASTLRHARSTCFLHFYIFHTAQLLCRGAMAEDFGSTFTAGGVGHTGGAQGSPLTLLRGLSQQPWGITRNARYYTR